MATASWSMRPCDRSCRTCAARVSTFGSPCHAAAELCYPDLYGDGDSPLSVRRPRRRVGAAQPGLAPGRRAMPGMGHGIGTCTASRPGISPPVASSPSGRLNNALWRCDRSDGCRHAAPRSSACGATQSCRETRPRRADATGAGGARIDTRNYIPGAGNDGRADRGSEPVHRSRLPPDGQNAPRPVRGLEVTRNGPRCVAGAEA